VQLNVVNITNSYQILAIHWWTVQASLMIDHLCFIPLLMLEQECLSQGKWLNQPATARQAHSSWQQFRHKTDPAGSAQLLRCSVALIPR
jgi:hypothetical protein